MRRIILWHISILVLAGLAVGFLCFFLAPKPPAGWDAISYFSVARNLLSGRGIVTSLCSVTPAWLMGVPHPDLHMPGYPLLLAGFMWFTRTGFYALWLLDTVLVILTSILVYFTVLPRSTPSAGLMASFIFMLSPMTLMHAFTGLAEIAVVFWSVLAVFLAGLPGSGRSPLCMMGSALAFFIAYITREISILLLPFLLLLLVNRGAKVSRAIVFGILVVVICFASSSAYYSFWPGFREVQLILKNFSLFKHTGLFHANPYTDIINPKDFPPLSPGVVFWDILIRKPVRSIVEIWQAGVWYFSVLDIAMVSVLVLAPIVAKERWQRLGLALFTLIIPALFIFYFPTYNRAIRVMFPFVVIALAFMLTWIREPIRKIIGILIIVIGLAIGIPGTMDRLREARQLVDDSEKIERVLREHLPPGPLVIGMLGSALMAHILHNHEDVVVHFPLTPEDAAVFQTRINMDAVVFRKMGQEDTRFYAPEEMTALGWQGKTIASGPDTIVIYTRKGE